MKHLTITITGKVQGVYFRASARSKAQELGIKGFTKNQPDGSVYIEAEGEPEQLDSFVEWCGNGPPDSVPEQVYTEEGPLQHYEDFVIAY